MYVHVCMYSCVYVKMIVVPGWFLVAAFFLVDPFFFLFFLIHCESSYITSVSSVLLYEVNMLKGIQLK